MYRLIRFIRKSYYIDHIEYGSLSASYGALQDLRRILVLYRNDARGETWLETSRGRRKTARRFPNEYPYEISSSDGQAAPPSENAALGQEDFTEWFIFFEEHTYIRPSRRK